jgi:hypothetical protein
VIDFVYADKTVGVCAQAILFFRKNRPLYLGPVIFFVRWIGTCATPLLLALDCGNDRYQLTEGLTAMFTCPVVGLVTKADIGSAEEKRRPENGLPLPGLPRFLPFRRLLVRALKA